jgi:hypothetical protein
MSGVDPRAVTSVNVTTALQQNPNSTILMSAPPPANAGWVRAVCASWKLSSSQKFEFLSNAGGILYTGPIAATSPGTI